ncbi:hypothetical protein DNJ95_02245 [Stutzerimonas kirkiae]|uniref:Rad50/SbcC-type AAA domain-containing protein n=1 Tax=Stutzerimonas kirkiae TaxID=2211392 RepID=A0A4Q9RGI2_9GAMM|nr:AAA family ATPase [Stutzerimonas kirkiae]TBV00006.1 hypothetical protein DNJ96_01575 [Stutzerimonas kirkiae]TBV05711.1 hypothetical protein DNJ95_02245 [Stutzerimonas kirkiae]
MISRPSTFFVNRFIISKGGKAVYDEIFHKGVNIIRGANSVGKSTIMDFLFNCLGGDIAEDRWNEEAQTCDAVFAEIELNGHILTIHRSVQPGKKPPMSFFDGSYEQLRVANSAAVWQNYGINRTDEKLSFSQQLFELLCWPHSQTDDFASLTIHQILRLIYVDQGTAVNKILRAEHSTFDKPSMRQAIGDFLLGLDDLGIYALKQQLSKAESEFAKIDGQLDSIYKYISPSEGVLREASLNSVIENASLELKELLAQRDMLLAQPDESASDTALKAKAEQSSREIADLTKEIDIRTSKQAEIVNEIVESELFIAAIESRIKALKESRAAYDFFGEVRFKFCPSCLSALSDSGKEQCHLCKTELDNNSREASYLAALNELAFQKKESTKVLIELRTKLSEHAHYLSSKQRALQTVKSNHITALRMSSDYVFKLNELSAKIGSIEERIKNYDTKTKLVAAVEGLIKKKQSLNATILELDEQIKASKAQNSSRRESIECNLSDKTVELLKQDGGFEPAFNVAQSVMFDFGKDFMLVDGRSKFSASSETILKNSFHLAILLESLEDESMRYPRLFLLDNTEDKGMGPDRSQNFQRVLVEALAKHDKKTYQVIMTTSMVDPDLDESNLCVGPHYKKGMHTLNI